MYSSQDEELLVLKDIHMINSKIKNAIENRNMQLTKLKQQTEERQTKYMQPDHQERRRQEMD